MQSKQLKKNDQQSRYEQDERRNMIGFLAGFVGLLVGACASVYLTREFHFNGLFQAVAGLGLSAAGLYGAIFLVGGFRPR